MSDVESDNEGEERCKRKTTEDNEKEEECEEKGGKKQKGEEKESERGVHPKISFVRPEQILNQQDVDKNLFAKTQSVRDFCAVLTGCCSIPNVDTILMCFTEEGMQIYAKPQLGGSLATAFFSKETFKDYQVKQKTQHLLQKSTLENLKKQISKDVEFIEITANENGFLVAGRLSYKVGLKSDFKILLTAVMPKEGEQLAILDLSDLSLNWKITTSAQQLSDNIKFFDDTTEFVTMTITPNPGLLEWKGYRDSGLSTICINQEIESSITEKFEVMFYKKLLKIVTVAKDINRSINIHFNMDNQASPVHFMYELEKSHPVSHFSAVIIPQLMSDN